MQWDSVRSLIIDSGERVWTIFALEKKYAERVPE